MRRILILALHVLMGHVTAMAFSGRFSAECSPAFVINRVYNKSEPKLYDKGASVTLHFGGGYHLALQEHAYLSLGVSYALGHISLARDATKSLPSIDEAYSLRYIWLPVLLRFYTSEVMLDTSIYCKLGIIPSINLTIRPAIPSDSGSSPCLKKRYLGCFILLGAGIKYDFSLMNSFTFGLSYCWDVPGIIYTKSRNTSLMDSYCHNNFFCFDLCCLF